MSNERRTFSTLMQTPLEKLKKFDAETHIRAFHEAQTRQIQEAEAARSADIDAKIKARIRQGLSTVCTADELDSTPVPPVAPTVFDVLRVAFLGGRTLPADSNLRKEFPLERGFLRYFPAAIACAAALSKVSNDKHNPGEEMHHARSKSTDQADCQLRHMIDAEVPGCDKLEELTCKFWRAGAELQIYCESLGAPMAPGARP